MEGFVWEFVADSACHQRGPSVKGRDAGAMIACTCTVHVCFPITIHVDDVENDDAVTRGASPLLKTSRAAFSAC